nr:PD40 domain-containing protein [Deltaproteobacteria bacterium]
MVRQLSVCVALAACGARPPPASEPDPAERIAIIASERGPSGTRLVAIDERGDRQLVLIAPIAGVVRDSHPAVSPDRGWIVFASSRGRTLETTSLWIAPLGSESVPVPLTTGPAIDSHPTWSPDGTAIVFASTRDGGDFDLWRVAIDSGRAVGEPVQLTSGATHEVTPTVAADGTVIYAAVTPTGDRTVESMLEERRPDGSIVTLTPGPADTSPALSPDGKTLAFARPLVHDGTPTSELWLMACGTEAAEPVLAAPLPLTEESGPVWSRDERFLFATSVMRGDAGVVFSSVIHIDLNESPRRARMLRDHAGAISR